MAALVLLRLAELLGQPRFGEEAERSLEAFAASAERMPTALPTYLRALDRALHPATTVAVVGAGDDPVADGLLALALRVPRARLVVRRLKPGTPAGVSLPEELRVVIGGEAPRAYLCAGRSCAPPTADPAELERLLREFGVLRR